MADDFEIEYRGLTLNADDYPVTLMDGFSPPDSREDVHHKPVEHGAYVYGEYLDARRLTVGGFIIDNDHDSFQTKLDALMLAFAPSNALLPLVRKVPGRTEERIYCIPVKRNYQINRNFSLGYTEWLVQLLASDPRIYDNVEQSQVFGVVANEFDLENEGNFGTFPRVVITGAATNPGFENLDTGEIVQLGLTTVGGDLLEIDFAERTIMLNDVTAYDSLEDDSAWWDLEPGVNRIHYTGSAGAGVVTMYWRSAWY